MLRFLTSPYATLRTLATLIVALVVLLGGGLLASPAAQAQTPITNVENGEGDLRFEVNHNGSLLVPGTFLDDGTENDSIPAEGAGTRLMWYPEKAAFRAGRVYSTSSFTSESTYWDASNVGAYSVALGENTLASGDRATAMGDETTASGDEATAMGNITRAYGPGATAMGSITEASGDQSTAMGLRTEASGDQSTAMGNGTVASGRYATAMGDDTEASALRATAMGDGTEASGDYSSAAGLYSKATGDISTAMGHGSEAIGSEATAMGGVTTAATDHSLSIGECNSTNTSSDRTILVVGNGTSSANTCDSRDDALRLYESSAGVQLVVSGDVQADDYSSSSDRRLKTDIESLDDGTLEALADIRPVRFQFKDEETHPSGEQLGVIAQEVREAFPELVSEGADGYLSVAYPKLSAVLLKGVQEQQATIETQSERIDRLEERLEALERGQSSSVPASLVGPWGLALLLGLGGLAAGLLWRRRE